MAHLFESGFTTGARSWHGLEKNISTPVRSVREALKLAGIDWLVSMKPAYYLADDGTPVEVDSAKIVVRDSDGRAIAAVGNEYRPIQNAIAFDVLQPLIDEGMIEIDTCGSLRGGARTYLCSTLTGMISDVVPGDAVYGKMLAYQGFDGKTRFVLKGTNTRVVCDNTLQIASSGDLDRADGYSTSGVFISHTANAEKRIGDLKRSIAQMARNFSTSIEEYRHLARKQCNPRNFFETLLRIEEQREAAIARGEDPTRKGQISLERLMEAYETQPGRQYAPGTAWQAYNAVTYHVDHKRGKPENRRDQSWFGAGAALSRQALQLAIAS